jgi:hypothetical protein
MSKSKNSNYCVLDHANKQGDRLLRNPNVRLIGRVKRRAADLPESSGGDADPARRRSEKTC